MTNDEEDIKLDIKFYFPLLQASTAALRYISCSPFFILKLRDFVLLDVGSSKEVLVIRFISL